MTNYYKGVNNIFTNNTSSTNPYVYLKAGQGEVLVLDGILAGSGDPSNHYLQADNTVADNVGLANLGISVSLSNDGNTMAVGANYDDGGLGAVYVFTRSSGVWIQEQKIVTTDHIGTTVLVGTSVSLSEDGNTLAIGGPGDNTNIGAVWIWNRSGTTWTKRDKLIPATYTGTPGFGTSVSLIEVGSTINLAIGGNANASGVGAVWIYTGTATTMTLEQRIVPTDNIGGSSFGYSVYLNSDTGNTLAIGGYGDNTNVGATWIYTRTAGTWSKQSKIIPTDNIGFCLFGTSVSLSANGDTLATSGSSDNSDIGAVWIYTRAGSTWTEQTKIIPANNVGNCQFGVSVSLSSGGDTLAIGAPNDNTDYGAVFTYERFIGVWSQNQKITTSSSISGSLFGTSVYLSSGSTTVAVGHPVVTTPGKVLVFEKDTDSQTTVGTANRITASGGITNVIDISSAYVGQTSITTLGTIGTGVWSGTVITGAKGGTGVNNSSKTITLGGNLTTSGAFNTTLTTTADTNVTLPTSGTLLSNTPAALTKVDDTNITLTLGGSPNTSLLNAASLTLGWTGQLGLTRGGTNNTLTASNGGVVYSDASKLNILAGTATANQILLSGSNTTPAWSTATYPSTTTINQLLYSSSANVIGGITTGNNGVLVTDSGGIPSISSTLPNATQDLITRTGTVASGTWGSTINTSTTITTTNSTDSTTTATGALLVSGGIGCTKNIVANSYTSASTSTATSAGTLVLTVSSTDIQVFTGSTTHTVTLPVVSTLPLGRKFTIRNESTGKVTINSSAGTFTYALLQNQTVDLIYVTSGTTPASWRRIGTSFGVMDEDYNVIVVPNNTNCYPFETGEATSPTKTTCGVVTENGGIFTVHETGWYMTLMQFNFFANATGYRFAGYIFSTTVYPANTQPSWLEYGLTQYPERTTPYIHNVYLNSGTTIKAYCYQNSGGNLNLKETNFTIAKLSPS